MTDNRTLIFEKILEKIEARNNKDRAFVIGITGIDCSGKSHFANSLNSFLISKDFKTQLISIDDFHNPSSYRYSGVNQADNYFNRSFNISTIIEKLLIPIHESKSCMVSLPILNLETDEYDTEKELVFNHNTIVIFEGVFLFRKELSSYIDYKVFLEITYEESKHRAKIRDSKADLNKYDEKYLPAQRRYLYEYPPSETADIVIDNSEWEHPLSKMIRDEQGIK